MTRPSQFRSGSALLIVLGMMSFMLFSGLAFSVYMRYARLPTSFLRRTTTTRQLAKAALAEAIEEIDMAIGDNPHPGVNPNGYTSGVVSNVWHHRVFFGVGLNGSAESALAPDYTAPSTLTLEGLAYLPPNMINDVRYYSRCTPTANWHPFWFDSGRYAYTAVDVSDYFDVNKVLANKGRAASASRRITLAHLFETGGSKHSGAGSGAQKWDDTLMSQCRTVDDKTGKIEFTEQGPFVSLADFNIAWNSAITFGNQEVVCPFRQLVDRGTPYGDMSASDPKLEAYRQLTFVTESWTPADSVSKTPNGKKETVDLATEQPFTLDALEAKGPAIDQGVIMYKGTKLMQTSSGDGSVTLRNHLSGLGIVQLWDYLDPDSIPLSLAVPTLERTPMIVGVEPAVPPQFVIAKGEVKEEGVFKDKSTPKEEWWYRVQQYNMTFRTGGTATRVLTVYPFRNHGIAVKDGSFSLDGRLAIFLTTADGGNMSLRPGANNEALHVAKDTIEKKGVLNDSVIAVPLTSKDITVEKMLATPDKPLVSERLDGNDSDLGNGIPLVTIRYEWVKRRDSGNGMMTVKENPDANDIAAEGNSWQLSPLNAQGGKVLTDSAAIQKALKNGTKLKVNAAVWARVSHEGDTVDLVPASAMDDKGFNVASSNSKLVSGLGKDYPLLRFDVQVNGQEHMNLTGAMFDNPSTPYTLRIENAKAIVADPRFNHVAENWYTISGTNLGPDDWLTELQQNVLGQDGRDNDIFMATSDQGYMQSVYELANLLSFGGNLSTSGNTYGNYKPVAGSRTSLASAYANTWDANMMWRTYRCYGGNRDDFENIGLVSGATGSHVNPYSDSTNVLMAAFANTPLDWRCSSTNDNSLAKSAKDAATFNAKYAWNGYDAENKLSWDCLSKIAGAFSYHVRNVSGGKWQDIFATLDWEASGVDVSKRNRYLAGVELDSDDANLYDVDKKFLYGFWHDSFGTQQQLFLIFVRAEPIMMGGGVAGQAPPQLGARAVALVWRDPNAFDKAKGSRGGTTPDIHRTRILFYHQFD